MRKFSTLLAVLLVMAVTAKAQTWIVYDYSYTEYNEWLNNYRVQLTGGGMHFIFDINCLPGTTDIVDGQTYSLSDMSPLFSGITMSDYRSSKFRAASIVRNSDGTYVADVTDEYGLRFHITKQPAPMINVFNDTIDVLINNGHFNSVVDRIADKGSFQLTGVDSANQYQMYLAVYSDQIAGNYTYEDVDITYTGLYDGDDRKSVYFVRDFTVTGNATACSTYVEMVTSDSILYRINYSFPGIVPAPYDTVDIIINDTSLTSILDYTSSVNMFQLVGFDETGEYKLELAVNSGQIAGSYTQDDVEMQYTSLYNNRMILPVAEIRDFTVTGNSSTCSTYIEIIDVDNILYRINCSCTKSTIVPTDTVDIVMNSASNYIEDYTSLDEGFFMLRGYDQSGEYELLLSVNSDQIAGIYTQIEKFFFGLYYGDHIIETLEVRGFTVTGNARACSTYIEMISEDSTLYRINYSYSKPVVMPTTTVKITMDNAEINAVTDATKSLGLFVLGGADQNKEYRLNLLVFSDHFAGTYTFDDVYDHSKLSHNGVPIQIDEVRDFTVTGNEKSCSTYIELVSVDSVLYKITYSYEYIPLETKDTIDITMDNAEYNAVFYDQIYAGVFHLIGADSVDEYTMHLAIYSDHIAGNYMQRDIDGAYTFFAHNLPGGATEIEIEEIRDFTVNGDEYGCNAYFEIISTDSVLYRITFEYGEVPSAVENTVEETEFVVCSENNTIVVYTAAGENVMVCDMAGRILMNSKSTSDIKRIDVAVPGIYVVRVADKTAKVLVK